MLFKSEFNLSGLKVWISQNENTTNMIRKVIMSWGISLKNYVQRTYIWYLQGGFLFTLFCQTWMRAKFCCSPEGDCLSHPRHPLSKGREILIDLTKMLRSRMIPGEWLREWLHHWQFFHFPWHSFRRRECCFVQGACLWVALSPHLAGHAPCPCISWRLCLILRTWRFQSR